MAQYKVLETSYIHNRLVKPGETVDWDKKKHGTPGPNLELIKGPVTTANGDQEPGIDNGGEQ